jgi:hypothetical protein
MPNKICIGILSIGIAVVTASITIDFSLSDPNGLLPFVLPIALLMLAILIFNSYQFISQKITLERYVQIVGLILFVFSVAVFIMNVDRSYKKVLVTSALVEMCLIVGLLLIKRELESYK